MHAKKIHVGIYTSTIEIKYTKNALNITLYNSVFLKNGRAVPHNPAFFNFDVLEGMYTINKMTDVGGKLTVLPLYFILLGKSVTTYLHTLSGSTVSDTSRIVGRASGSSSKHLIII